MSTLAVDTTAGTILTCKDEIVAANAAWKKGKSEDRVLLSLAGADASLVCLTPTLASIVLGVTHNTYDARMLNPNRKESLEARLKSVYLARKQAQCNFLLGVLTRMRGQQSTPPELIRRTLELRYTSTPKSVWRLMCSKREVLSESWVEKTLSRPSLRAWRPPHPEEDNTDIELHVRDNLEWWLKIKFNRMREGKLLKSEIKHTATGEVFYTPARVTAGLTLPDLGNRYRSTQP